MKKIIFISLLIFSVSTFAQTPCEYSLKTDSCVLLDTKHKELVSLMDLKIKKTYQVQFIKHQQKTYLKLIVTDNLGFGKTGPLLLLSNKKQFYIKNITLNSIDKTLGYFLIELNPHYLSTIKENGLTSIEFNNIESTIPKQDSELIKKVVNCFSEAIIPK